MKKLLIILTIGILISCSTEEEDFIIGKWTIQQLMSEDHEVIIDFTQMDCRKNSNIVFKRNGGFISNIYQSNNSDGCDLYQHDQSTWDYNGENYIIYNGDVQNIVEIIDNKTLKYYVNLNGMYTIYTKN